MDSYIDSTKSYMKKKLSKSFISTKSFNLGYEFICDRYDAKIFSDGIIKIKYPQNSFLTACDEELYLTLDGELSIADFSVCFKKCHISENILFLPGTIPNLVFFDFMTKSKTRNLLFYVVSIIKKKINKDCCKKIIDLVFN